MKMMLNGQAMQDYRELREAAALLDGQGPALEHMAELSGATNRDIPTALTRLEVYKECHNLADDLYRLTGSKKVYNNVLRIGNLLLARLLNRREEKMTVNH